METAASSSPTPRLPTGTTTTAGTTCSRKRSGEAIGAPTGTSSAACRMALADGMHLPDGARVMAPAAAGPLREAKRRPMVVVSSDVFHAERPQDLLAALVIRYRGRMDHLVQEWRAAGLHQPSVVRCTLAMIEHHRVAGQVGGV